MYAYEMHIYKIHAYEIRMTPMIAHVPLKTLVWVPSYLRRLPSNFIKLPASKRVLKIIL
jgi:hypothetical protein